MDGGSVGDGFVGVNAPGRLFPVEEFLDELLDFGDASGSADEHDLVDLVLLQVRVGKDLLHRLQGSSEEILKGGGDGRKEGGRKKGRKKEGKKRMKERID